MSTKSTPTAIFRTRLALARLADLGRLPYQHLRPAGLVESNSMAHSGALLYRRMFREQARRRAGSKPAKTSSELSHYSDYCSAPRTRVQYARPLSFLAIATPTALTFGLSRFSRWPELPSQPRITSLNDFCPEATFSAVIFA